MRNASEDEVIRKLREHATRGELNGIDVFYRVTGGAPGERPVDEELHLSGPGPVTRAFAHHCGGHAASHRRAWRYRR